MKAIRTPNANVLRRAQLVAQAMRANPKRKIAQIARDLGMSYWACYRYARGDCKCMYALGR